MKKNFLKISTLMVLLFFATVLNSFAQVKNSDAVLLTESFDGTTFPPVGWANTQVTGTGLWARSTAGTYPVCTPHSGAGMAYYNSYTYPALVSALLVTPVMVFPAGVTKTVDFWMYRDPGYPPNVDSVGVYCNTAANLTGAIFLGNIRRQFATVGWYQFTYTLPASVSGNYYVIFKATSGWGNNMYIDDVTISSNTTPPVPVQHYNYLTGTNNNRPINIGAGNMIQTLVGPGEFTNPTPAPGGSIERLYLRIGDALGPVTYADFKISLGQTTATAFTAGAFYAGTMTTVFSRAGVTYTAAANSWLEIILDVPFTYNPAQSLVVQIEQRGATGAFTGNSLSYSTMTNRRIYSIGPFPWLYGGIDNNVANLGIAFTGAGVNNVFSTNSIELMQNYPNPFNNKTIIAYKLIKNTDVVLKVYDLMGKEVSILVNKSQTAGKFEVEFDGSNLPSGIYMYQLTTNSGTMTKRMILEK